MICRGFILLRGGRKGHTEGVGGSSALIPPGSGQMEGSNSYGKKQVPLQRTSKGSNGKKEKN